MRAELKRAVSIHAPPEGRDLAVKPPARSGMRNHVSIHAPPEGRDHVLTVAQPPGTPVSIHAPPEGRDLARRM